MNIHVVYEIKDGDVVGASQATLTPMDTLVQDSAGQVDGDSPDQGTGEQCSGVQEVHQQRAVPFTLKTMSVLDMC